ncbi:MAG: hypothetical protein AAF806_24860 [Bacteroidota bacterium]
MGITLLLFWVQNIYSQNRMPKWWLGTSMSSVFWSEDRIFGEESHWQSTLSLEVGYNFSTFFNLGFRQIFIRERLPFERPFYHALSGVFLQANLVRRAEELTPILELGVYSNDLYPFNRLPLFYPNPSQNELGFGFGGIALYNFNELISLGGGLNYYIPFAKFRDANVGILVTPKLEVHFYF